MEWKLTITLEAFDNIIQNITSLSYKLSTEIVPLCHYNLEIMLGLQNSVLSSKTKCLLISSNLSDFGEPPQLDYKNEIYAAIVLYCQADLN